MSFLCRVAGLNLKDRMRSSDIREELGVKPLLLHIKRSQLGWLGHLARMPSGRLPLEVFQTCPTGRRPRGRPRTRWRDYISHLAWERLGVPPEELMKVAGERAVWAAPATQTQISVSAEKRVERRFNSIHFTDDENFSKSDRQLQGCHKVCILQCMDMY
ncbi:Cytoplasmic dynein 2 heavy chain 1 [Takifugu flavidus]|uniref:Cytoplasmic dynein 2 heavy chain 1 n=1 Tax=Takifugu flavidus TaxID=433684 RepID=A0A5C6PGR0_9TELE|nr:Cytoplasmic dynein 2 heavy chain 1 [Takifugu flavidus]